MLVAIILGAGIGLGALLLATGLRPARPDLSVAIARLHAPPAPAPARLPGDSGDSTLVRRVQPLARHLEAFNLPSARVRKDLALIERSPISLLAEKTTAAIGAGLVPAAASIAATALLGFDLGPLTTVGAALLGATAGFIAPDYQTRAKAAALRTQMRHDLSAYLDLTVITLAGGAGTESALTHAAAIGDSATFERIRRALTRGAHQGRPAADVLTDLGAETGVDEFTELGASLSLAGSEGARIRATLTAKATAMRRQALADETASAGVATERLSLPLVLLVIGFLVFIGYPAIATVAATFNK
jgi:pilus assembly protein TadC